MAENNPKFAVSKGQQAKYCAKSDPSYDTGSGGHALMPQAAASNPAVKNLYINGHFCYAQKAVIVTNGLGIMRHLELLDEDFRVKHPEVPREKRTKSPEIDKEIGDSTALKPVLRDFRAAHPALRYGTFSADAAFDSFDNLSFLLNECRVKRAVIPFNPRNAPLTPPHFNEHGTPLCPLDDKPFVPMGGGGGPHRSPRLKFVCPGAQRQGTTMVNRCPTPCTSSGYGRCVYVNPDKNLRLYPGISRDAPDFAAIYTQRTAVERSISSLKETLCLQNRKTSNVLTTKADLFLAGIVQLLCVLLAGKLHRPALARRTRLLLAA